MKDTNLHIQETQQIPSMINLKIATLRHISIKLPIDMDRENPESSKRKDTCPVQGIFDKINGQFIIRSHGDQKAIEWNIYRTEREKKSVNQ